MQHRNVRGRLLLVAFVALCVTIITLDFRQTGIGPLERAQDAAATLVAPLQKGFTAVLRPVDNFFSSVRQLGSLRSENSRLRSQLEAERADDDRQEALADENVRLHEQLDLRRSWPTMRTVTAQVIGENPSNYKWAVQIDKGRSSGIRVDMPVIDPDGLVGKVVSVTNTSAQVLLLIDPGAGAKARIEGADVTGFVAGSGATDKMRLELVGTTARVEEGDEVVTSSYNRGVFPPGIPVGTVSAVEEDAAALQKLVTVEPEVNFTDLDLLEVLLVGGGQAPAGGKA